MNRLKMAALILSVVPLVSYAKDFSGDVQKGSSVSFVYKQMGVPLEGKFGNMTGRVSFDPAKPETATARLDMELSSIDVGSQEGNQEVAGKQWFDSSKFPKASFSSSSVKKLSETTYEMSGTLEIKGRPQKVTFPVAFSKSGNNGVFDGKFVMKRADFSIGEGSWAKFDVVANEVQVSFHIIVPSK